MSSFEALRDCDSCSYISRVLCVEALVCYTAVFSVVTQREALRDEIKNGCVAD